MNEFLLFRPWRENGSFVDESWRRLCLFQLDSVIPDLLAHTSKQMALDGNARVRDLFYAVLYIIINPLYKITLIFFSSLISLHHIFIAKFYYLV